MTKERQRRLKSDVRATWSVLHVEDTGAPQLTGLLRCWSCCAAVGAGRANQVLGCHLVTLLGVAPQTLTAGLQHPFTSLQKSCTNPVFYCTTSGVGGEKLAVGQKNTKAFTVGKKCMEFSDLANWLFVGKCRSFFWGFFLPFLRMVRVFNHFMNMNVGKCK